MVDRVICGVVERQDVHDVRRALVVLSHVTAPVVGVDEEVDVHVVRRQKLEILLRPAPGAVGGVGRRVGTIGDIVERGDDCVVGDVGGLGLEADLRVEADGCGGA